MSGRSDLDEIKKQKELEKMENPSCRCNLVIDFDSTFVKLEALEDLASIALRDNDKKDDIVEKIKEITAMGMEGKITFPQSLNSRLKLFSSNRSHVEELVRLLKENITVSAIKNKEFFIDNSNKIYIISGGFEDFIFPIVGEYGIQRDHILANKFKFDEKGYIAGIDQERLLAQDDGKVKIVKSLNLKKPVCVVGDGWTDYEIKKQGAADLFCAFCENVSRKSVVDSADYVANNFDEVIDWIKSN